MSKVPPSKTVWLGDLEGFEDEAYFNRIFSPVCKIISFKMFKEPNSKNYYGFVEFENTDQAKLAISLYNGKPRPFSSRFSNQYFETQLRPIAAQVKNHRRTKSLSSFFSRFMSGISRKTLPKKLSRNSFPKNINQLFEQKSSEKQTPKKPKFTPLFIFQMNKSQNLRSPK